MHKIFEIITEIVGWIQIVLSPTLLGIGFGFGIYHYFPNENGMIFGLIIAIVGFIIGITILTTPIFKKSLRYWFSFETFAFNDSNYFFFRNSF